MAFERESTSFASISDVREALALGRIDLETAQLVAGMLIAYDPCYVLSDGKDFLIFKKISDDQPNFDDYPEVAHGM